MYFETEEDRRRELKAIQTYTKTFGGTFIKLSQDDIDFKLVDEKGITTGYVEVKGRVRSMRDAYPLPVAVFKLLKLYHKRLNPIIIWSCDDGIIYAKVNELVGTLKEGGRKQRENAVNDKELMAYFDKQRAMRYIRFV